MFNCRCHLLFLQDEEQKIKEYFEMGLKDILTSISMEGHRITIKIKDGEVIAKGVGKGMGSELASVFENQTKMIWNHFRTVETQATGVKINLLHQLKLFQTMYEVDCSASDEEQLTEIVDHMFDICEYADGLLVGGNGTAFVDLEGKIILNDNGQSDVTAYQVKELKNILKGEKKKEAVDRRERSQNILSEKNIYVPCWLPFIETEEEADFRNKEEVTKRLLALTLTAIYSEGILGVGWEPKRAYDYIAEDIKNYQADDFFSAQEKAYLKEEKPEEKKVISFSWNYEMAWVMYWALGFVEELDYPDHICDVKGLVNTIKEFSSFEEILENAKLRSEKELLDADDLYFCYNWSCVDVRTQMDLAPPANMEPSVVFDRHRALNWLVGFGGKNWDNIRADT